ncbi:MAG: hypothetical protein ACYDBP_11780 [Leptospirales bacterium]
MDILPEGVLNDGKSGSHDRHTGSFEIRAPAVMEARCRRDDALEGEPGFVEGMAGKSRRGRCGEFLGKAVF